MTIILEEKQKKEKINKSPRFCHYVPAPNAPKSFCGLSRKEICRGCQYSDYYGMECKCGRETCPLCRLALEGVGQNV